MQVLTERQAQILQFICNTLEVDGYPPTLREIADRFDMKSTNGVNDH